MEKQGTEISETELAGKVVFLHDQGLGFRKIAKELASQGYRTNKDICNRLYIKYKQAATSDERENKELEHLRETESRALLNLKRGREKEEIRRRLAVVFVERRTLTFRQRKELFTDSEKLLRFCWRIMPTVDAALWDEFVECCQQRDYDLADAVAKSLGNQQDYETQSTYSLKKFDAYLREKISKYLAWLLEQEQREKQPSETANPDPSSGEMEIVTIELPDDFSWL
jgi:hypothetical protein